MKKKTKIKNKVNNIDEAMVEFFKRFPCQWEQPTGSETFRAGFYAGELWALKGEKERGLGF